MAADTHERIFGLTAFRTVTTGTDLAIQITSGGPYVYPRGLLLGTGGNVVGQGVDDTTDVTLTGLSAGVWHPICLKRVTSTTGANLVVGY